MDGHSVRIKMMSWFSVFCPVVLLLITFNLVRAKQDNIQRDLQALSSSLPGCYSNLNQYHRHAQRGLPSHKRSFLIKSELYRISSPMFNDSLTVYFQDFTKSSTSPFRLGFYSFAFDSKMKLFRMRTYKLSEDLIQLSVSQKPSDFVLNPNVITESLHRHGLGLTDLQAYSACDMFWKRIAKDTFVGITGPQCLGSLGKDQVRIGVSMTLSEGKLLLTEGWYNVKDGSSISEYKVPYVLNKLRSPELLQKDASPPADNLPPASQPQREKKVVLTPKSLVTRRDRNPTRTRGEPYNPPAEPRVLRTFRQVASALMTGYDVRYRVELGACALPNHVSIDRLSFGGQVKEFVFVRRDGAANSRSDYVHFTSATMAMGSQGLETINRDVTIFRGGRVNVKVTKSSSDHTDLRREYVFECRLFDDRRGYGAVKITTHPGVKPQRLTSAKSMLSSLGQGRDLRVVTDLTRCQGQQRKIAIIFGSHITEYDFNNHDRTIEVHIPLPRPSEYQRLAGDGFMGQFMANGDVALIKMGDLRPVPIDQWQVGPAFHCRMTSRSELETNDENEASVGVFYRK
ncbi:uncharacterized protein LOC131935400 [Physella acuta]|uniref:uncharacterized protein LOC131935400 n=1 Tax=Physella acuta TaxID=109671 RepID=UPI0027DAD045|nr:uncharacterized protein LOC131935400 [Physella acuta]